MKHLPISRKLFYVAMCASLALPLCLIDSAAASEPYPNKSIKLVVPFAPGGPADIMGRELARSLTESMGQSVVVDNRPGAGGNIGTDIVAKSPNDGYTIGMIAVSSLTISPHLYPCLLYTSPSPRDRTRSRMPSSA